MKRIGWIAASFAAIAVIAVVAFLALGTRSKGRVLTFDSLDRVRLGMTVAEAEAAVGVKFTPMDPTDGVDSEACWTTVNEADPGVSYMVWDGKIVRIAVAPQSLAGAPDVIPSVVTEKGVGLLTSVNEIKQAYGPDLVIDFHNQGDPGNYDHLHMTVLRADNQYGHVFDTWDNRLTSIGSAIPDALHLQEGCF